MTRPDNTKHWNVKASTEPSRVGSSFGRPGARALSLLVTVVLSRLSSEKVIDEVLHAPPVRNGERRDPGDQPTGFLVRRSQAFDRDAGVRRDDLLGQPESPGKAQQRGRARPPPAARPTANRRDATDRQATFTRGRFERPTPGADDVVNQSRQRPWKVPGQRGGVAGRAFSHRGPLTPWTSVPGRWSTIPTPRLRFRAGTVSSFPSARACLGDDD